MQDLLLQFRAAAGSAARYASPRSAWLTLGRGVDGLLVACWTRPSGSGLVLVTEKAGPPVVLPERVGVRLELRSAPRRWVWPAMVALPRSRSGRRRSCSTPPEPAIPRSVCSATRPTGSTGWPPRRTPGGARAGDAGPAGATAADRAASSWSCSVRLWTVPAADRDRFLADFLPALRRAVPVVTDDETIELPAAPVPQLALAVGFRPEHRVRLDWSVRYRHRDEWRRFGIDDSTLGSGRSAGPGGRARAARRPRPAVRGAAAAGRPRSGRAVRPRTRCWAVPTPRSSCTTSCPAARAGGGGRDRRRGGRLPTGRGRPRGHRVHRGERSDRPATGSTCTSRSGSTVSWCRSRSCSSRSASGAEFLVLETGVYVPLDNPALDRLRELIEEAQALQDRDRPSSCGSAAFQTALWDELTQVGVVIGQADGGSRRSGRSPCPTATATLTTHRCRADRSATPSCGPTSATGSAGWPACGGTGWVGCSPTTWGWARRSRRWR